MKITFMQDHMSYLSGNSFYATGMGADLPRGAELVALGVARAGWGAIVFDPIEQREEIASEPAEQGSIPLPAPAESASFQIVRGIGPEIEAALYNAGILTWENVLQAGVVEIDKRIASIGMTRARALFAMAQREAN